MANFLLIHGAMHGGWCWERVVPLLEAQGHTVSAPDLPGMGQKHLPPAEVTLEIWARFVADLLAKPADKSILVGHSLGGMVISQAAEWAPDKIAKLVYLTALLPRDGDSAFGLTRGDGTADLDARMQLLPTPDGLSIAATPQDARAFLYGDTSDEWADLAVSRMQPQPLEPLKTPAALTAANFGSVPRVFVECLRDRIIPLPLQRKMHAASPCESVLAIDTDHSPFYSTPEAAAGHLLKIAKK